MLNLIPFSLLQEENELDLNYTGSGKRKREDDWMNTENISKREEPCPKKPKESESAKIKLIYDDILDEMIKVKNSAERLIST